jgi:ADP-heptose:LPS heptosyltransferase
MKCVVPLLGGIGNIIQTTPFMQWLRKNGWEVIAERHKHAWSTEICEMVSPAYSLLVGHGEGPSDARRMVCGSNERIKGMVRAGMPEWAIYFKVNGFDPPGRDEIGTVLDFTPSMSPSRVILAPCCKKEWPMKRWPHWQRLIDEMPGCAVVGMTGDGGQLDGEFIDLRGKTSLRELAGILNGADSVIAEEGGVAHMACAVQTPTVILYGGTMVSKNLPPHYGNPVGPSMKFPCRPCQGKARCYWYKPPEYPHPIMYGCRHNEQVNGFSRCMDAISVEDVKRVWESL